MQEYYAKTTPRQVVREYEKMGVEFENIGSRNLEKRYKMRKMRNAAKIFQESFGKIPKPKLNMIDEVEQIIDEAYKLYMPQVRSEITDLAAFLITNTDLQYGRPIKVLEIGTKFGGTFYIWNKLNEIFAKDREHWSHWNASDLCISIDMSDGGIHGGISEEEMDKRDLWFCERFSNCHFIRGDSHSSVTSAKLCEILFNKNWNDIDVWTDEYEELDFLFIDGDHSYEGVEKDFKDYSGFVKQGGIIVMHDIIISEQHHSRNVYVGEFWNYLKENCPWEMIEIVGDKDQTWAGIGILIKK